MSSIQLYDHTAYLFMSGANSDADTYKVELLDDNATFNAAHTTKDEVDGSGAYEVYGNGWTQGGEALANVVIEQDGNDSKLDADDLAVDISGGDLGPYKKYVVLNNTDGDIPLAFITMDSAQTVTDGNVAGINWNADGIIRSNVTA